MSTPLFRVLRQIILSLVGLSVTVPALAQTLTLEEAIRRAVSQNFQVRLARVNETSAGLNSEPGNAGYLPTVTLNGQGTFVLQQLRRQTNAASANNPNLAREVEVYNVENQVVNANVTATYVFFNGFQRKAFYEQLQLLAQQADIDTRIALENVISGVTRAYYDLVQQQRNIRLLEQNLAISQERVRIAQERQAVGAGSGLEALQSTVDLNADRTALLRQQALAANASVTLQELMGERPGETIVLADTSIRVDATLARRELNTATNRALSRLQRDVAIAEWGLRSARGARWPVLSGTVIYNFNRSEAGPFFQGFNTIPFFNLNYGPTALVNLSIPLFDGRRVRRGIQQAELTEENAQLRLAQTQLNLDASLQRTWIDYQTNLTLMELESENAEVAARNADVALERFRIGSSTPLELREAQVAFVLAQQRLLQAQFTAKAAEIELNRLSGRIAVGE